MAMWQRLTRQIESPPVWLVLFVLAAVLQSDHWPVWPSKGLVVSLGFLLIGLGLGLFVVAARAFRTADTTILPRETPSRLMTTGIYGWSRNPIYLADTILLTGIIFLCDLGALVLVPVFSTILYLRFIRGEEARCAATFGAEWQAYAARVRRWL
jgi:protein-S-isoprenylcysteine O-methyltransferase Ste14